MEYALSTLLLLINWAANLSPRKNSPAFYIFTYAAIVILIVGIILGKISFSYMWFVIFVILTWVILQNVMERLMNPATSKFEIIDLIIFGAGCSLLSKQVNLQYAFIHYLTCIICIILVSYQRQLRDAKRMEFVPQIINTHNIKEQLKRIVYLYKLYVSVFVISLVVGYLLFTYVISTQAGGFK